jgi:hypothetical protein
LFLFITVALLQEYFGYAVDINDPRFKALLAQKDAEAAKVCVNWRIIISTNEQLLGCENCEKEGKTGETCCKCVNYIVEF